MEKSKEYSPSNLRPISEKGTEYEPAIDFIKKYTAIIDKFMIGLYRENLPVSMQLTKLINEAFGKNMQLSQLLKMKENSHSMKMNKTVLIKLAESLKELAQNDEVWNLYEKQRSAALKVDQRPDNPMSELWKFSKDKLKGIFEKYADALRILFLENYQPSRKDG